MQAVSSPQAQTGRLVPLSDPRRKRPRLVRLGDVPSLFSEGPDDPSQRLGLPRLDELRARLGQIFQVSVE